MKELKCKDRVYNNLQGRLKDLQTLLNAPEYENEELGSLYDYGLCVDYVEPNTFNDQKEGYIRYQLSWGGPSDEFRYFINPNGLIHRIEYWFMDWYDGANLTIADTSKDYDMLKGLYDMLYFFGAYESAKATQ